MKKLKKPFIIAIDSQKGGVGKSTISSLISFAMADAGLNCLLVDTDIFQRSAADSANESNSNRLSCVVIPVENLLRELKKTKLIDPFDVIVIDGRGTMDEKSKYVMEVADYFIVPVKSSQFEINSLAKFKMNVLDPIRFRRDVPGAIVINEIDEEKASCRDTQAAIEALELPYFLNNIPQSEYLKKSAGLGVPIEQYRPSSKACRMFMSFFKELCDDIGLQFPKRLLNKNKKSRISVCQSVQV